MLWWSPHASAHFSTSSAAFFSCVVRNLSLPSVHKYVNAFLHIKMFFAYQDVPMFNGVCINHVILVRNALTRGVKIEQDHKHTKHRNEWIYIYIYILEYISYPTSVVCLWWEQETSYWCFLTRDSNNIHHTSISCSYYCNISTSQVGWIAARAAYWPTKENRHTIMRS